MQRTGQVVGDGEFDMTRREVKRRKYVSPGKNPAQVFVYPRLVWTSVRTAPASPASQCHPANSTERPGEYLNNVQLAPAGDFEMSHDRKRSIISIIVYSHCL